MFVGIEELIKLELIFEQVRFGLTLFEQKSPHTEVLQIFILQKCLTD